MQNNQIADKASRHAYKAYTYTFPSGETTTLQGYEKYAMDALVAMGYTERDLVTARSLVPEIWYTDGTSRRYFVDIYIPAENMMIEVKSMWTLAQKQDRIRLKMEACVAQGYKYEIWVFDAKGNKIPVAW